MDTTRDLARGTLILDYRIEAVLGRGGMSVVYLAEDMRLKRRVALKLLAPALAGDERFRERFLRESELAASLDHANVIPVYEAGEADDRLYIAMRYVEGSDLRSLLADGPVTHEQAVTVTAQIGAALDAAHERGLVHGDVKPSNILVDARGHPYLADFGLTKYYGDDHADAGDVQLLGTIDYVAPEQIRGEPVDGRADVYSLGCVLYECLTGRQPFRRGSDAAVLFAHLEDEPPSTGTAADAVVAKALAKTPEERYQSCGELSEAAREALGTAEPRRSRLPYATAAVVAAIALAVPLVFFFVFRGGTTADASALSGRLIRIDGNRVGSSAKIGADPSGLAVGDDRVWVTTRGSSEIWSVIKSTLATRNVKWSVAPAGIAVDDGIGYVLDDHASITRIDLGTGLPMSGRIQTPGGEVIAGGGAGIWAAGTNEALRIATVSQQVERVVGAGPVPQPSPTDEAHVRFDLTGIAVGRDAVWITGDALDRRLFRLDPRTGRIVAAIPLPFIPSSVAVGDTGVWVTGQLADVVARFDPATNRLVGTIKVGREPMAVATGTNAVWVGNALDDTISRIDPRTNRVTATVPAGGVPRAIAADGSSVWVAADDAG